ncbi:MAG: hypothetical protein ABS81_07235 [Pseudonocardia sp. SCN 72-86]|nr:MAG: hypothetical protein ABS81_07235 [Pseudonocardia sp. SCN 72-86]
MNEVYGKPVGAIVLVDQDVTDEHVPPTTGDFGVVVHRSDREPTIHRCDSARERDDTLVPFYAYFYSVTRVDTFGPDL